MREDKVGPADEQQPTSALIPFKTTFQTSPPANTEFTKPGERKKRKTQSNSHMTGMIIPQCFRAEASANRKKMFRKAAVGGTGVNLSYVVHTHSKSHEITCMYNQE